MIFILVSFLATSIFGFLSILVINYALVSWENTKINDLASKIKQTNQSGSILNKGSASHHFTSVDVSDNLRSKLTHQKSLGETAGQFYDKTMTVIKTQDYAGWWQKLTSEITKLRQNWWGTLKQWFGFLFSLAKPIEDLIAQEDKSKQTAKEEKHKAEMSDVVEKVKEAGKASSIQPNLDHLDDASKTFTLADGATPKVEPDKAVPISTGLQATEELGYIEEKATIDLGASFDNSKQVKDMSQFEKLEQKLLNRLQDSGLKNYGVWIQLGDFYLKYDEKEKAKEIFALVLKQATGDEKEVARNRLISF